MSPNNYEKETRTNLHNLQEKVNKTKEELEDEIHYLKSYQEIKELREQTGDYLIGVCFILGVVVLNFILPYFIGSRIFSTNFNPKIGPADITALLIGGAFIWKGLHR